MINKVKKILPILLAVSVLLSCTERIDLPLDESSVRLVVEGSVTTNPGVQTIYLTETTDYYYNQKPPVVTGADVTITDGQNLFILSETSPGIYQTSSDFTSKEGFTYTLNIKLIKPIGGFSEFNASSVLKPLISLDSAATTFFEDFGEQGLWEVNCWFQDQQTTDFYRFDIYRNSHLVTHKLEKWLVTDDKFFNGDYVNGGTISYLEQSSDNEKLVRGDMLIVEMSSISREFYNYIQDAQAELRGSNPLFSGPGANVRGNISNGAIGFFAAYPVSRVMIIVP
ncbi:MAG: DUF4249 domain-containing protein [Bacteroidetes bacterium]|nr:DUF4249 domain-containing protein [Bacteroidota bacterium]